MENQQPLEQQIDAAKVIASYQRQLALANESLAIREAMIEQLQEDLKTLREQVDQMASSMSSNNGSVHTPVA